MLFNRAVRVDTQTRRAAVIAATVLVVVSAIAISSLVGLDEKVALYAIAGVAIFLFAFLNTDFALSVLILSMLLSPEFSVGGAGGVGQMAQRNVVIRIDDLLLGLITVSWLVKTAVNKELGLFIRTPLNRPIFIYLIASLFSTFIGVFTGNVRPLIGILYNVKYFQYFLIFLMVSSHVKDLKTANRYIRLMLFTALAVSIYAIAQIPSGVRVSAPFEGKSGEANTLGGYLVVMLTMLMGLMTGLKGLNRLAPRALLLLLMAVPFLFTLSRSSWIAMIPAVIVFVVLSPKRRYLIIAILALGLVTPLVLPEAVWERINYTFSPQNDLRTDVVTVGDTALDPSTSARIFSWTSTLKQWSEKPVFGWGVTGAGFKDAQYFRVLAETGVIGFVAFLYLLITIHRTAMQRLRQIDPKKHPRYHGLVVGYIAGYWGLLAHAIGANTFVIVRIMEPFWFLTALVLMLPDLIAQEEKQEGASIPERAVGPYQLPQSQQ